MKRKLKFISIIALILAIIISLTSSCFADETDLNYIEHNGNKINLSGTDGHPCFIIYSKNTNRYIYFGMWVGEDTQLSGSKYWCSEDDENYIIGGSYNNKAFNDYCFLIYNIESGETENTLKAEDIEGTSTISNDGSLLVSFNKDNFIAVYRTTELYSDNTYTQVSNSSFFQQPPVGVLAPIVEEAPLGETIKEIVGILPIVLIILVGLIGLRKGLALLSQTLHKA